MKYNQILISVIIGVLVVICSVNFIRVYYKEENIANEENITNREGSPEEKITIYDLINEYETETKDLEIMTKVWTNWTRIEVSRYNDKAGNIVRYHVDENDDTTDYYIQDEKILIKTKRKDKGEFEQAQWWMQEGNKIVNVNTMEGVDPSIMSVQQVHFLYEKLLDEQEQNNFSNTVTLGKEIVFQQFEDYKRYLTYENEDFIKCVYTYESDGYNLTLEQALDLCASAVAEQSPNLKMDRIMEQEEEGFVGYKFNLRELGDGQGKQIIENKIGVFDTNAFDGMAYCIYMYEDVIDDLETGEGHMAITATFTIFLRDRLLIKE